MISVIEVSCGEYGNNIKNLVNAIKNGKRDIRAGYSFPEEKEVLNNSNTGSGNPKEVEVGAKITETKDKNDASNIEDKFRDSKANETNGGIIPNYASNDIDKQSALILFLAIKLFYLGLSLFLYKIIIIDILSNLFLTDDVSINVDAEKKDNVNTSLLDETLVVTPERYPTSEFTQFWIVLKRTLLFSRRDWVGIQFEQLFAKHNFNK